VSQEAAPEIDPGALIRSREYRRLLVIAAFIGVLVSLVSWGFLELVHWLQQAVYQDLPSALGLKANPWWWPLPVLAVAGLLTALAVLRLPGGGGHVPFEGIKAGVSQPIALPGILLAGLASLGLGLVLGPEGPLIALGSGLAVFAVKRARKDTPDKVLSVIAAAAAFAALSTIFGSPVVGAVILIEAAGLGGPTLPLILLPGLMSAGIGSLVFVGMGNWTGLSNNDYALSPFTLPAYSSPTLAEFGWTVVLAVVAACVAFGIVELARASAGQVGRKPWLLIPAVGLVVAGLAIGFAQITGQSADVVLFSGESAFTVMFSQASTLSLGTLLCLLVFKGVAWGLSMGSFRGGPTFPALFIGAVGGLLAAHLPGFSETPAVAALMGAMAVSILRLPLSSVVLALLLTSSAGIATAPIVIVAVVVAYITIESLSAIRPPGSARTAGSAPTAGAAP
jgi:H+/Cl- antiporter ClcA